MLCVFACMCGPTVLCVQANRRKKVGAFVFQARDPLPSLVPQGDKWNQCISNRVFKGKVIQLVIERLSSTLALAEGQSLIVDYQVSPASLRRHSGRSSHGGNRRATLFSTSGVGAP